MCRLIPKASNDTHRITINPSASQGRNFATNNRFESSNLKRIAIWPIQSNLLSSKHIYNLYITNWVTPDPASGIITIQIRNYIVTKKAFKLHSRTYVVHTKLKIFSDSRIPTIAVTDSRLCNWLFTFEPMLWYQLWNIPTYRDATGRRQANPSP